MWHEAFNAPQINLWSENWPYLSSHYMTHHFNWIQDGQKSQESLTYLWASGDEHLRETTLKTVPTLHSLENRNNGLTNWAILCSEGCLLIRLDENLIHFGTLAESMKTECELNWKMIFHNWKVNLKVNLGHPTRKRRWNRWNYRSIDESRDVFTVFT